MIRIESLQEPLSVNTIYRAKSVYVKGRPTAIMYLTAKGRQYKTDFSTIAKMQYNGDVLIGDIKIVAYITFGTKRKKDISNMLKLELDALQNVIYLDDSQIVELHLFKRYKKNKPSLVLEITELI